MNLLHDYINTGMIQFGRFKQPDGKMNPISINFLLMPSFPKVMQATAKALTPLINQTNTNRLLTTRATTPLGAALAIESDIPMTYPYGEAQAHTNAYIIEGAYDVGHPTTLLSYTIADPANIDAMLVPAEKVGLTITNIVSLFTIGDTSLLTNKNIQVHTLFSFVEILESLHKDNILTPKLYAHVMAWWEAQHAIGNS